MSKCLGIGKKNCRRIRTSHFVILYHRTQLRKSRIVLMHQWFHSVTNAGTPSSGLHVMYCTPVDRRAHNLNFLSPQPHRALRRLGVRKICLYAIARSKLRREPPPAGRQRPGRRPAASRCQPARRHPSPSCLPRCRPRPRRRFAGRRRRSR